MGNRTSKINVLSAIGIALVVILGRSAPAAAATIEFQATNLGGNSWEYQYFPSAAGFQADQGFAVFFDYSLHSTLQVKSPLPPDWDPLVEEPIPALMSDGFYDALALVNNASLAGPFRVSFVWLGLPGTTPGAQPFEIYELDAQGFPDPFEFGRTIPIGQVPEPPALVLLMAGAAVGLVVRRRLRQLVSAR